MHRVIGVLFIVAVAVPVAAQLPPVPTETAGDEQQPKLYVEKRFHDIGSMVEGEKRTVGWTVENRGTADLVITDVKPSCGCTVVQLDEDDRVIRPGGSLELKTEFDSQLRRGTQSNYVRVFTNDPLEPELKLDFKAEVESLVEVSPSGVINLRGLQRGQPVERTVEIIRAESRKSLEIAGIDIYEGQPIHFDVEPIDEDKKAGYRISFKVPEDAPLGTLSTKLRIKLRIDEFERERVIVLHGEIAGDLTWQPRIIDVTRYDSGRGKRLKPVTIRSTDSRPFEILGVSAGPLLSAECEPMEGLRSGTQYRCFVTIHEEAPPGPFGATLTVRTDLLDQPVVEVPVFAIVPPLVDVVPPVILFRQDGTPVGTERLIKLQTLPQVGIEVLDVASGKNEITATINRQRSGPYQHIRYLDVKLTGTLPKGRHESVVTVKTTVEGAETLEIPVTVDVP